MEPLSLIEKGGFLAVIGVLMWVVLDLRTQIKLMQGRGEALFQAFMEGLKEERGGLAGLREAVARLEARVGALERKSGG